MFAFYTSCNGILCKSQLDDKSALVQIMTWCQDKPLQTMVDPVLMSLDSNELMPLNWWSKFTKNNALNLGKKIQFHGLAQDCGNSSALALELPQSCAEPSRWSYKLAYLNG